MLVVHKVHLVRENNKNINIKKNKIFKFLTKDEWKISHNLMNKNQN